MDLRRFGLLVAQRPSSQHGGMCLLVAQTMASDLLLGGGSARRLFQPSNFFTKRSTALFLNLSSPTAVFLLKLGSVSGLFPSLAAAVVVFLPLKRALPKITSPFCRRRRPDGVCPSTCIPPPCYFFWHEERR